MEILSQCEESTLKDFKPSPMNHGKGSVVVQLVPMEHNRLTMSETVSIDEPASGSYQLDIGAGAFKRAFVTHWNTVITAVKRTSRTSECDGREKEEMLKEDFERNVTLCLQNSFWRNREPNIDPLPCCKQRVEEQKCWRTASNSVRIATDVLQDTETESAESMSQEEEMER